MLAPMLHERFKSPAREVARDAARPAAATIPSLMPQRPMLVRWRNFVRFRAALRHVENDLHFTELLTQWRALTREYSWEFVPGIPLNASQLRGIYDSLPVQISLAHDAIRVLTTFSLALPAPPRPDLLEAIERRTMLRERTDMLLDAFADCEPGARGDSYRRSPRPVEAAAARTVFASCHLDMSTTHLWCTARYVNQAREYAEILAAMSALSLALTGALATNG